MEEKVRGKRQEEVWTRTLKIRQGNLTKKSRLKSRKFFFHLVILWLVNHDFREYLSVSLNILIYTNKLGRVTSTSSEESQVLRTNSEESQVLFDHFSSLQRSWRLEKCFVGDSKSGQKVSNTVSQENLKRTMTSIGYVHEKEWRSEGRCQDGHIEEVYRYSR